MRHQQTENPNPSVMPLRHLSFLLFVLPLLAGCAHIADQPPVSVASPLDADAPPAFVASVSPLAADATTRAYNARMAQVDSADSSPAPAGMDTGNMPGMSDMAGMSGMVGMNETNSASPAVPQNAKPLYYTCPMHPEIHSAAPGKCPICGMTLVPHYGEDHP